MPSLADQIRGLVVAATTDLDESLAYYEHTKAVWRLLHQAIQRHGMKFTVDIQQTAQTVDQNQIVALSQPYISDFLLPDVLRRVVTTFEEFIFDLIEAWLMAYPRSLGDHQISMADVLDSDSLDDVKRMIVAQALNKQRYSNVRDWMTYLQSRIGMPCPDDQMIGRLVEIKATRDIHVHGQGIANAMYQRKAGTDARVSVGDYLPVDEPYFLDAWKTVRQTIEKLGEDAATKSDASVPPTT